MTAIHARELEDLARDPAVDMAIAGRSSWLTFVLPQLRHVFATEALGTTALAIVAALAIAPAALAEGVKRVIARRGSSAEASAISRNEVQRNR